MSKPFHLVRAFGVAVCSAALLVASGCGSSDDKAPVAKAPPEKKAQPSSKPPETRPAPPIEVKPDPAELWSERVEAARQHLAAGELDEAQAELDRLGELYAEPDEPTAEQQAERDELAAAVAKERRAIVAQQRAEQLARAEAIIDEGKLEEVIQLLNAVRASAPTPDQLAAANRLEQEVERRRESRRRLQTWIQLLGSSNSGEVRSAQTQLSQDPGTALSLLVEAVREAEKPVLVVNAMELLRRLKRPEVALPAMVGVLERPEQQQNWPDAVREITRVGEAGAGELLLRLVLAAQAPQQRHFALQALTRVPDPPPQTPVALLPLIYQDSEELPLVLQAAYHAVHVHGQYDLVAQRALDADLSADEEEQLFGLAERLAELVAAGQQSASPDEAAHWARVLALASRQLAPQPLEGIQVHTVSAESSTGPAAAVLDGEWSSTEPETMWRYPVDQRGTLVLDLGEQRTVTGVRVWNLNEAGGTQRGWKEVEIFVSDNPRALTPNAAGVIPRAPGAADTPDFSTVIPVGFIRGRYVKLQAKSVWAEDGHTGLSEIQVLGF